MDTNAAAHAQRTDETSALGAVTYGTTTTGIAYQRLGDGPVLVLVHGLGASKEAWAPVLARLAAKHTVYAVDLPGFGASPPLDGDEPTPRGLANALDAALDELGIADAHVTGHSLGAWVGLELATMRSVSSLTLLAPAGLWRRQQPLYDWISFHVIWTACRYGYRPVVGLSRWAWGRRLLFAQLFAHPERLSQADLAHGAEMLGRRPGFMPTLRATRPLRYRATTQLTMPMTLVFGSVDRVLLAHQSRFTDELPEHARQVSVPDAGHVLMSDAPEAVADVILETTGSMVG